MRYRALDPAGDYQFGRGASEWLVNSPACVAQAIQTALRLSQGEWYLDTTVGVPYNTQIFGTDTQALHDQAIQEAILGVPGVLSIDAYASSVGPNRKLFVQATVTTQFGVTTVQQAI